MKHYQVYQIKNQITTVLASDASARGYIAKIWLKNEYVLSCSLFNEKNTGVRKVEN